MYSFSTCWNSHRHTDGRAMLREIRDLGFEYAELSHGTRISLMPGILEAVDAGEIRISSLHNFCPLPMGVESRRAQPLPVLRRTSPRTRTGRSLHAQDARVRRARQGPAGRAAQRQHRDEELHRQAARPGRRAAKRKTPKYAEALRRAGREARGEEGDSSSSGPYESLRKLLPEAEARGIKLGIENRQALEELPLESDFDFLFREIASPNVVYWHDTGHAQIKENLGFIHHAMHLESLRDRLSGFHIHDVQFPGRDHCAPGTGMIDFAALKPMVKPEHIKVFEFSPGLSVDEAQNGVAHLKKIWGSD